MSLQELRSKMPEYAKDIKLNLGSVMTEEGSAGLTMQQIAGIALSSALTTKSKEVIAFLKAEVADVLSEAHVNAAKAANAIMGMNNVYYRFVHLASNKDYQAMPAKLRMNVIANPGIDKIDFELYSLAISAINACGMCIDAHEKQLLESGVSKEGIQSCIRIASVVNAAAQVIEVESA